MSERAGDNKKGERASLQVAELLNYLAMENHVSTVRGAGLNVSISANQHVCVDEGVVVPFTFMCVKMFLCVRLCVGAFELNSAFANSTCLWPPSSNRLFFPCFFLFTFCSFCVFTSLFLFSLNKAFVFFYILLSCSFTFLAHFHLSSAS